MASWVPNPEEVALAILSKTPSPQSTADRVLKVVLGAFFIVLVGLVALYAS